MDINHGDEFEFLLVDSFIRCPLQARTLLSAIRLGLIQTLAAPLSPNLLHAISYETGVSPTKLRLLLATLIQGSVVEIVDGQYVLSEAFRRVRKYEDLIAGKIALSCSVVGDYLESLEIFLTNPERFQETSTLFNLFDYSACLEITEESCARTAQWMDYTTVLSKYEARAFIKKVSLAGYERLLDIGGNSGEFAYRLCEAYPKLRGCVADLPVVCHLGSQYMQTLPQLPVPIGFVPWDLRSQAIPGGFDLLTFKSILHDWPEEYVLRLLHEAHEVLSPGGSVVIFERSAWDFSTTPIDFSNLPVALFCDSYRPSGFYLRMLYSREWSSIRSFTLRLDTPFMLLIATR